MTKIPKVKMFKKVEQYSPAGDETSLALKLFLSGHDFDFKTDDGGMGSVEKNETCSDPPPKFSEAQ